MARAGHPRPIFGARSQREARRRRRRRIVLLIVVLVLAAAALLSDASVAAGALAVPEPG